MPEKVQAAVSFIQTKVAKAAASNSEIQRARWRSVQSLMETVQSAENPFTSASERKSNVVIDLLEKLKEDFAGELQTKTTDEKNA